LIEDWLNAAVPCGADYSTAPVLSWVFEEDKAIVESHKPECLPLDPSFEAHIAADRSSIVYRRGLRDMGFSRFFIS
jgi:hypothetical protein